MNMKKFFIVVIALIAASSTLRAEGFNITAGYTNFVEKYKIAKALPERKGLDFTEVYHGFYVGVGYTLKDVIGDCISITPGLQFVMNYGKKQHIEIYKYWPEFKDLDPGLGQEKDSYLQIPVRFSYGFETENARFSIFAGPKFIVGMRAAFEGENGTILWYGNRGTNRVYNRFNLMLGLGGSVNIGEHFRINVGYDWGVLNRVKADYAKGTPLNFGGNSVYESMLTVGFGFCF